VDIWSNQVTADGEEVWLDNVTIKRVYLDKKTKKWEQTPNFRPENVAQILEALEEVKQYYDSKNNATTLDEDEV